MKVAIIGFGVEGRALAAYFVARGEYVTVCDVAKKLDGVPENVTVQTGAGYLKGLKKFDAIFRSPGIPFLKGEFDGVREKLTSLTKYFFEHCPCPIIGVTGTKGKGTTSSLLYEILKTACSNASGIKPKGRSARFARVFLGGNIGHPPLAFLDELTKKDVVILELSSFQLQDLTVSPHMAVVLGITPDHQDHHRNFEEYAEAKKNIVKFQDAGDIAVFDNDNEIATSFAKATKAKKRFFSIEKPIKEGGFVKVGSLVLKHGATGTIIGEKGHTKLIGAHNLKNILAAAIIAQELDAPVDVIMKVVKEFPGLPHRLELVRDVKGVRYYNDSASTNPDTTIAAVRAFASPLIVILGGSEKNADFTALGKEIAQRINVRSIILMGATREKLEHAIEEACAKEEARRAEMATRTGRPQLGREAPLDLILAESYQEAFMVAKLLAVPGDTVLLSPACASFDMFTDYKERGEIFRHFVTDLE